MKHKKLHSESILCYVILFALLLICLLPLVMVFSTSISSEEYVRRSGYTIIPRLVTLETYSFLFQSKAKMLFRAYRNTLGAVVFGTLCTITVTTCFAYAVTQKKEVFRLSRPLAFFAWFTTIFSGGVLPWYILCTQYYGLKNNIWSLFLPYGLNVWYMFILRGNFREIPTEILEAAEIDGASRAKVFWRIAIPLARGGITSVSLFSIMRLWNDFQLPNYFVTVSKMSTITKLLYDLLNNAIALLSNSDLGGAALEIVVPTQTARMAVVVMTILPIILMYPFTFKYFVKGINVGGIKG